MWIVITRTRRPDASIWPGRKGLAAIDAVVWPLLWVVVVWHAPAPTGLIGPVVCASAALSATMRLRRALWANERYWFTTWRWGKVAAAMLLMGWVLKLAMLA
jgi:hypothetical protein